MLYIGETGRPLRTRFSEHRRAVCANDASQPVARYFNSGSHVVSDMKIRVLCPISGSNDSHKRHEMHDISKLGILHPSLLMVLMSVRFLTISFTSTCLTFSDMDRFSFAFCAYFRISYSVM